MEEVKTLATLVLGGAWDANELGDNDIMPAQDLIDDLQQRLVTGFDDVHIELVDRADLDRVTSERNALQLLLNTRDDLDDQLTTLEQRRYAEQQACQAAERRVVKLKGLLRRISKHYENSDVRETNRAIDEIEAAINPTAEG